MDGFHSVIYKDEHVNDPYRDRRTVHPNGCGLTDDVSQWMDRVQHGHDDDDEIDIVPIENNEKDKVDNKTHYYQHVNNRIYDDIEDTAHPHKKYSKEANSRVKRATSRYQEKNTCSLYIQTDPLIWRHIRESIPDVSTHKISHKQLNLT